MNKQILVDSFAKINEETETKLTKQRFIEDEAKKVQTQDLAYRQSLLNTEDSDDQNDQTEEILEQRNEGQAKLNEAKQALTQIDNERSLLYSELNIQQLYIQELEESLIQKNSLVQYKCKELNQLNDATQVMTKRVEYCKQLLKQRDNLIQESQLLKVIDNEECSVRSVAHLSDNLKAKFEEYCGSGDFEDKLSALFNDREELMSALRLLILQAESFDKDFEDKIEEEAEKKSLLSSEMEKNRRLRNLENQFALKTQEISALKTRVSSLESQVVHYESSVASCEESEDSFRNNNRQLRSKLREMGNTLANKEMENQALQNRLDRLKRSS